MHIFITGGCKNGKSTHAQQLAQAQAGPGGLYYLATMAPCDAEDRARVERHRQERAGMGFTTLEQATNLPALLPQCPGEGSFLLDSLTAWLSNEMFSPDGAMDQAAPQRLAAQLPLVLAALPNLVLVSDYLYGQPMAVLAPTTRAYCRGLALLDRVAAAHCQVVLELCYGQVLIHKGRDVYETLCQGLGHCPGDVHHPASTLL